LSHYSLWFGKSRYPCAGILHTEEFLKVFLNYISNITLSLKLTVYISNYLRRCHRNEKSYKCVFWKNDWITGNRKSNFPCGRYFISS